MTSILGARPVCTEFIYRGVFRTEADALEQAAVLATEKSLVESFRVVDGEAEGEVMSLNDVPLQFGPAKKYRDRRVTIVS